MASKDGDKQKFGSGTPGDQGTYSVVGWYEGEARVTRPVVVQPGGWTEVELVAP